MNKTHIYPDERGYFGEFGGKFVPETLMYALEELEEAYKEAKEAPSFWEYIIKFVALLGG